MKFMAAEFLSVVLFLKTKLINVLIPLKQTFELK